jgi:lactate dehydrogenase-like 2-hydroxyacid dehydrogenase
MPRPLVLAAGQLSSLLERALDGRYDLRPLDGAGPLAEEATVVVTMGSNGLSKSAMDALPALRLIALHSVGYDKVDVAHARSRGIAVTNTPDVLNDDVADMAIALVLATARRVVAGDRYVRDGRWAEGAPFPFGRKVTGARFGILGLGRIGTAIARRLEPFSTDIAYHNRSPVAGCRYRYLATPEALARESDFLIVATSGGSASAKIVDAAVLEALGPDGMLVNIGRGSTVDQDALIEALETGRVAGAGLDVFASEPDVPARLRALDQVVLQPHQASATNSTRQAMADLVVDNIDAFFQKRPLLTPLDSV